MKKILISIGFVLLFIIGHTQNNQTYSKRIIASEELVHLAPTAGGSTDSVVVWNPTTFQFHVVHRDSVIDLGNYTFSGDEFNLNGNNVINEDAANQILIINEAADYDTVSINGQIIKLPSTSNALIDAGSGKTATTKDWTTNAISDSLSAFSGGGKWTDGSGTNSIYQNGIDAGGTTDEDNVATVGKLGVTKLLDNLTSASTHNVEWNQADSMFMGTPIKMETTRMTTAGSAAANETILTAEMAAHPEGVYIPYGSFTVNGTTLTGTIVMNDSATIVAGSIMSFDEVELKGGNFDLGGYACKILGNTDVRDVSFTNDDQTYGIYLDQSTATDSIDIVFDNCTFTDMVYAINTRSLDATYAGVNTISVKNCTFDNVRRSIRYEVTFIGSGYIGYNKFKNHIRQIGDITDGYQMLNINIGKATDYNAVSDILVENNESWGHSNLEPSPAIISMFVRCYARNVTIQNNYYHDTECVSGVAHGFEGIYMNGINNRVINNLIENWQKGTNGSSISFKAYIADKYQECSGNTIINNDVSLDVLSYAIYGDGVVRMDNNYIFTEHDNTDVTYQDIRYVYRSVEGDDVGFTDRITNNTIISDRTMMGIGGTAGTILTKKTHNIKGNTFISLNGANVTTAKNTAIYEFVSSGGGAELTNIDNNIFRMQYGKSAYYNEQTGKESIKFTNNDFEGKIETATYGTAQKFIWTVNIADYTEISGNTIKTRGYGLLGMLSGVNEVWRNNEILMDFQFTSTTIFHILTLTSDANSVNFTFDNNIMNFSDTTVSGGVVRLFFQASAKDNITISNNKFYNPTSTEIEGLRGTSGILVDKLFSTKNYFENINTVYGENFDGDVIVDGDVCTGGDRYYWNRRSVGSLTLRNVDLTTTGVAIDFRGTFPNVYLDNATIAGTTDFDGTGTVTNMYGFETGQTYTMGGLTVTMMGINQQEETIQNQLSQTFINSESNPVLDINRISTATSAQAGAAALRLDIDGDMVDGFGPAFFFRIRDNALVDNIIASFGAVMDGADTDGKISFRLRNTGAWVEALTLDRDGFAEFGFDVDVAGDFTNHSITYPTADGSANQGIVTDAAGNLTFSSHVGDEYAYLTNNIPVSGVTSTDLTWLGEARTQASGQTTDYATDFACNNQHAVVNVTVYGGAQTVTFTGVSMSESSGIPTAAITEAITVDATGRYQTDTKWLEVTDITWSASTRTYDVEILGYIDAQNRDFSIEGMRVDMTSGGVNSDILIEIIKVQDDGAGKMSLVVMEALGVDAATNTYVDEKRTAGNDRSYTTSSAMWSTGENFCLKQGDYSTFFSSDENVFEGSTKAEGYIIQLSGTGGGNINNVDMLNLAIILKFIP